MACVFGNRVIDVTELSENVIWELETAFSGLVAPESIILLACGVDEVRRRRRSYRIEVREQLLAHLPPAQLRPRTNVLLSALPEPS